MAIQLAIFRQLGLEVLRIDGVEGPLVAAVAPEHPSGVELKLSAPGADRVEHLGFRHGVILADGPSQSVDPCLVAFSAPSKDHRLALRGLASA